MPFEYLLNGWFRTTFSFQLKKMPNISASFGEILDTKFQDSSFNLLGELFDGGFYGWEAGLETLQIRGFGIYAYTRRSVFLRCPAPGRLW